MTTPAHTGVGLDAQANPLRAVPSGVLSAGRTMASSKSSSTSSWQGTVLSKENLETYTDWLNELRDHVYSRSSLCGELMEHHLVGEPCAIPVVAGGPASTGDDSQQVVGINAGRRRQMHSAKSCGGVHRLPACRFCTVTTATPVTQSSRRSGQH